jgi:hypothetical protein
MRLQSTGPFTYRVPGRPAPSGGPVLAVLTDGPADLAVAAQAVALAARTGAPVVAAAAVQGTGFGISAMLHVARARRMADETAAITGRVLPLLQSTRTPHVLTALLLPAHHDTGGPLPARAVRRAADHHGAALVVSPTELEEAGRLLVLVDEPLARLLSQAGPVQAPAQAQAPVAGGAPEGVGR